MSLVNIFTLDLDIKDTNYISEPNVTSNDTIRFIINITDEGLPFDLTGSTIFTIASTRPDGQVILKAGEKTGASQLTFNLGAPSTTIPGRVNTKIQMYDPSGRVSAIDFSYMVTADPSGTNYVPTSYDQTLIQQVLGAGPAILEAAEEATDDANEAATNANTTNTSIQSAETIRVGSENTRVSQEAQRQTNESTRSTNESGRQSSESSRVTAESGRVSAEASRVSSESSRVSVESARVSSESSRASAESSRVTAENTRVSSESTRGTNETARISAESARASSETSRETSESTRASQETGRVSAENTRVSSETTRGSNETARQSSESTRTTSETARVAAESARATAEGSRATAETTRANQETSRQNTYTNVVNNMAIYHKGTIETYDDLPTTGLTVGDTYTVTSDEDESKNGVYRRQNDNTWLKIYVYNADGKETVSNVGVVAKATAEIIRMSKHSGVIDFSSSIRNVNSYTTTVVTQKGDLQLGDLANPNTLVLAEMSSLLNGYKVVVKGFAEGENASAWATLPHSKITLPPPPKFGTRKDLVFLEGWFPQNGNGYEMSFRIRTVAGVDFTTYNGDGFSMAEPNASYEKFNHSVTSQGGNSEPLATSNSSVPVRLSSHFAHQLMRKQNPQFYGNTIDDAGLYVAGDGSQEAKDLLKTLDGYVYAIPLFCVERRNSGGYREDNQVGARDYISLSLSYTVPNPLYPDSTFTITATPTGAIKVGDVLKFNVNDFRMQVLVDNGSGNYTVKYIGTSILSGTATSQSGWFNMSDHPQGLYNNIININDVTDLRHHIPNNPNYEAMLESAFDQNIRGQLTTNLPKTLHSETYGLKRAPMGLPNGLQAVKVQRPDGSQVELTNLLGVAGGGKSLSGWTSSSGNISVSTVQKHFGNSSFRYTPSSPTPSYLNKNVDADINNGKAYLVGMWVYIESYTSGAKPIIAIFDKGDVDSARYFVTSDTSKTGQWQFLYKVIPSASTITTSNGFQILAGVGGGGVSVSYSDGIFVYEIPALEDDLIDVDADWTGSDNIAALFPYVDSLPVFGENECTDFPTWTLHANATIKEPYSLTLGASASFSESEIELPAAPNTIYAFSGYRTGRWVIEELNSSGDVVATPWNDSSGNITGNLYTNFLTTSTTVKIRIIATNVNAGTYTFNNPRLWKYTSAAIDPSSQFVPHGRWMIPANYPGYNTHLGNSYNTMHYPGVGGDSFNAQRSVVSDALTIDTHTDIVVPLSTPQGNIKTTQATAGIWTVGDTIEIKNDYGVVTGPSAGVCRVVATGSGNVITVDDVTKFSVNDTAKLYADGVDNSPWDTYTITAVDTTNKTLTINTTANSLIGHLLIETTASSSLPSVTTTDVAGTWTGLGTKKATYTITTAPTINTDTLKITYAMVFPPGKGMTYVPEALVDGYVNGERFLSSVINTVSFKANFEGKVSGDTDANPHFYSESSASTLTSPSAFAGAEVNGYANITTLNGLTRTLPVAGSGEMAQSYFRFDLIQAFERKYGEIPGQWTTANKVTWLRANISSVTPSWTGYGHGPGGYNATAAIWKPSLGGDGILGTSWAGFASTTASSPFTISNPFTQSTGHAVPELIDSNGFLHILAYADASDGTTASTINTDYVELSVTLTTAETGFTVLQPDNPFPVLAENILTANQALPVDTSGFTTDWSVNVGSTYSIDSVGVLKVVTDGSVLVQGVSTVETKTTSGYHGISMEFKGPIGQQFAITSHQFNFALDSAGTIAGIMEFTATGDWQRIELKGAYINGSTISTTVRTSDSALTATTFYVRSLKINKGPIAELPWTPGRNRMKTLNFLGKIAGSTSEVPHKILYNGASTLSAPTGFTSEVGQNNYDDACKQDGTLLQLTASTADQYAQQLFEFDLSHLGLSLKELKAAIRSYSATWVGYGSGENSGLVYGATLKVWNQSTDSWDTWGTPNATSSPSSIVTGVLTDNVRMTNDQKIYILVHSTYPAGTNSSNLYTDYIKLDVTLADYVDYKKSNIVKIRPETKEMKLMFPAQSYRYTGTSGVAQPDVVKLNYRHVPYQGLNDVSQNPIITKKTIALTTGTGKYVPWLGSYKNSITRLPSMKNDWEYVSGVIVDQTSSQSLTELVVGLGITGGGAWDGTYAGTRPQAALLGTSVVSPRLQGGVVRGWGRACIHESEYLIYDRVLKSSDGGPLMYATATLSIYNGEAVMTIVTYYGLGDVWVASSADMFKLPGRPLLKGV
jgi:hypothetical protein